MNRIDTDCGVSIYQFTGKTFEANSYVITEGNEALIIDAVDSSDMVSFLLEEYARVTAGNEISEVVRELQKLTILLTHEHFDHIGGLETLRGRFRCHVIASKECSQRIQSPKTNLSSIGNALLAMHNGSEPKDLIPSYEAATADEEFSEDCDITWNGHRIFCHPLRGHSPGSTGYVLDGNILFSGDEILPIPTLTRLPGGNTKAFWYEDMPWLGSIRDQISLVCPGHGMPGKLEDMISGNTMPEKYKDMGEKANAQEGHL